MFMTPEIVRGAWWECETRDGTFYFPADEVSRDEVADWCDVDEGGCEDAILLHEEMFGARLSASGYMDCTEWTIHESECEAWAYLRDTYGDCGCDEEGCETCELWLECDTMAHNTYPSHAGGAS